MADVTGQFGQEEINLNNAATEATLKELLNATKVIAAKAASEFKNQEDFDKALGKLAKSSEIASKGGKKFNQSTLRSYKAMEANTEAVQDSEEAYKQTVASINKFKGRVEKVASSMVSMINTVSSAVDSVRGMDGSVSSAVGALGQLPMGVGDVIKGVFGPVAGAVDQTHQAFLDVSSAGANFGGNMATMNKATAEAGLNLSELSGIVKSNSEGLMFLGGSTDAGAKRLLKLGKDIRNTPLAADLARLGYSTTDINEGFAQYAKMTARAGRLEGMKNEQLIARTGEYLKNLDAVSKLTGKTKESLQAEADARMADAQFQQMKRKLDEEGQIAFETLLSSIPKELQAGAKEVLSTGTATSKAGTDFIAFMKKSGPAAQGLYQSMRETGTLTKDQVVGFSKTMQDEAKEMADSPLITTLAKFDPAMNDFVTGIYKNAGRTKDLGEIYDEIEKNLKNLSTNPPKNLIDPATVQNFKQDINEKALEMTTALASIDLTKLKDVFNKAADIAIEYLPKAVNLAAENFELVAGTVLGLNVAAGLATAALNGLAMSRGLSSMMGNSTGAPGGPNQKPGQSGSRKDVMKNAGKGVFRRFAPLALALSAYEGITGYNNVQDQVDAGEITSSEGTVAKTEVVGEAVGGGAGALTGAAAGAAIGSVVPIVGTAIGGLIGGAIGYWAGSKAGSAVGETIGEAIAGPDTIKEVEQRIEDLNKAITEDSFSSVGFSSKDEKAELAQLQKDLILLKQRQAEEEKKLLEAEGSPANPDSATTSDPEATSSTDTSTTATDAQKKLEAEKEAADKKAAEEAKKKEEEAKKKIQDDIASASETKKTPEEIMLALNTNIEELVSLTRLSNSLAQNHIRVSQGLSNDAYTVG